MTTQRVRLANHRETMGVVFYKGAPNDYQNQYQSSLSKPERILQCAIKHPDGMIYSAQRPGTHYHIELLLAAYNKNSPNELRDQGFVTNHGRYLNRLQATKVAVTAQQLKLGVAVPRFLQVEHLW